MTSIYLASPYSHPDPAVRQKRFEAVSQFAAKLMQKGHIVFCPIAHTHPMDPFVSKENNTHGFWLGQDFYWLKRCEEMYICMLDGWEESTGVQAEVAFARTLEIPITLVDPYDD